MRRLWAPWRMEYILSEKGSECIFCKKIKEDRDEDNYILYRGTNSFVMMNVYPYNNGHLMVMPYLHLSTLEELGTDVMFDMMNITQKAISILRDVLNPDGFNVGMNFGKIAGAGMPSHLHIHIIPRWMGDTDFMPLVAETRVMPEHLKITYRKLLPFFKK